MACATGYGSEGGKYYLISSLSKLFSVHTCASLGTKGNTESEDRYTQHHELGAPVSRINRYRVGPRFRSPLNKQRVGSTLQTLRVQQ